MTNINNAEFKTASEAYNWLFPKISFDGVDCLEILKPCST